MPLIYYFFINELLIETINFTLKVVQLVLQCLDQFSLLIKLSLVKEEGRDSCFTKKKIPSQWNRKRNESFIRVAQ